MTAMDAGQRAAEVEGKGQKESGVRMFYTGWSASTGEADWALSPLFASQNWPPTLFNTAFYSNKQVDDFTAQALKTNDPAEKTRLYKAAQDIIWQESPWIPLVVEKLVSAHSKNLTGFGSCQTPASALKTRICNKQRRGVECLITLSNAYWG